MKVYLLCQPNIEYGGFEFRKGPIFTTRNKANAYIDSQFEKEYLDEEERKKAESEYRNKWYSIWELDVQ